MKTKKLLYVFVVTMLLTSTFTSCSNEDVNPVIPTEETECFETVLNFFTEINAVPRPSNHEEKMRQYLKNFAQIHGLKCLEIEGNIIIYKDATDGMEKAPMVCLQTHMDMVCVAADGYEIDFLTQGIEPYNDGKYIWSKDRNTSLGADDGIGMAIVLAVLNSNNISHGPLECLFTWNEEDGLTGSAVLPKGVLKSKYMINIDWEGEGETCLGTAGGIMMAINMLYEKESVSDGYSGLKLQVSGLTGGHSGVNIVNGGANAIKLLSDFFANEIGNFRICDMDGGSAPNAIATSVIAKIVVPESQKESFSERFDNYMKQQKQQYANTDPTMIYSIEAEQVYTCMTANDSKNLVKGLSNSPQGVMEWSNVVYNMFETSNNVGVINLNDESCIINYYVRGFNDQKMDAIATSIELAYGVGTIVDVTSDRYSTYSAWTADPDAPLMIYSQNIWKSLYGLDMQLVRVGGGMEPSNFSVTYPEMQIFTYGPNVFDAHSINEHVEINSIQRTWQFTLKLLKNIVNL